MKNAICCLTCVILFAVVANAQWALTGNAISTGNFIGTTNSQDLILKVNTVWAGFLSQSSQTTGLGVGSLSYVISDAFGANGTFNAALGYWSQFGTTTGGSNTSGGYQALSLNLGGIGNAAFGSKALANSSMVNYLTASGSSALFSVLSGVLNEAHGAMALFGTTTGMYNSAMGCQAAFSGNTANGNTAIAGTALYSNQNDWNTAIGFQSLYNNADSFNVAVGINALFSNTSGPGGSTAVGYEALQKNTTGFGEAFGESALAVNQTGEANVAIGDAALGSVTSSSGNAAIGALTGSNIVSSGATYNTAVGIFSGPKTDGLSNTTALGYDALTLTSHSIYLGNSAITSIAGHVGWTAHSDGRFKRNIKENVPGIEFIRLLRPITYTWDLNGLETFRHPTGSKTIALPGEAETIAENETTPYTGFIAQEVEAAAQKLNFAFSGVDAPKDPSKSTYGLRYAEFVVPLTKAAQQLSNTHDSLTALADSLENVMNTLQITVDSILQQVNNLKAAEGLLLLKQNIPNPFSGSTVIRYVLPPATNKAQLVITDISGHILKAVDLGGPGEGQVVIGPGELAAGTYFYTLYINDQKIATRQMVMVH